MSHESQQTEQNQWNPCVQAADFNLEMPVSLDIEPVKSIDTIEMNRFPTHHRCYHLVDNMNTIFAQAICSSVIGRE